MKIASLGEQKLIERLSQIIEEISQKIEPFPLLEREKGKSSEGKVALGIGDDAALWQPAADKMIALSTDTAVEGVHFPHLSSLTAEEVALCGSRAATANLSDLAATAARPTFALINLTLPPDLTVEQFDALYRGLARQLYSYGAEIIGGNLSSAPGPVNITITVGGETPPTKNLRRDTARAGDLIGVTGAPGSSAAGLFAIQKFGTARAKQKYPTLTAAYFQPIPRVKEAILLAPYLNALTDISDGLPLDLENITRPSGVGAEVSWEAIPKNRELPALSKELSLPLKELIFGPSDDYELLFTAPKEHRQTIEEIAQKHHIPLAWIGEIREERELILKSKKNSPQILAPTGWNHFQKMMNGK